VGGLFQTPRNEAGAGSEAKHTGLAFDHDLAELTDVERESVEIQLEEVDDFLDGVAGRITKQE
jgi:hypothetical protein